MAGTLRALVDLPIAVEDCRKGWLAAARAQGRDSINCYIAYKLIQCMPSNAKPQFRKVYTKALTPSVNLTNPGAFRGIKSENQSARTTV